MGFFIFKQIATPESSCIEIRPDNADQISSIALSKNLEEKVARHLAQYRKNIWRRAWESMNPVSWNVNEKLFLTYHQEGQRVYNQLADTLIRVFHFSRRKKNIYVISFRERNRPSEETSRFLEKGSIPVLGLLDGDPDLILVDVGPRPTHIYLGKLGDIAYKVKELPTGGYQIFRQNMTKPILTIKNESQLDRSRLRSDEKIFIKSLIDKFYSDDEYHEYVEIPGEINFSFDSHGFDAYDSGIEKSIHFLDKNPRITGLLAQKHLDSMVEDFKNLWVFKKVHLDFKNMRSSFIQSYRDHRLFAISTRGNLISQFGLGLMQGGILTPLSDKLQKDFGILPSITFITASVIPNLISLVQIKSASLMERIRNAQKDKEIDALEINLELRKIQFQIARNQLIFSSILAGLAGYSLFSFGTNPWWFLAILGSFYIYSEYKRSINDYHEEGIMFRLLKGTIANDPLLQRNLLQTQTMNNVLETLAKFTGQALGYFSLLLWPLLGIVLSGLGWLSGILAKFGIPYYGIDYKVSVHTSFEPNPLNETNKTLIPGIARISTDQKMEFVKSLASWQILDPKNLRIIVDDPREKSSLPEIQKQKRIWPFNTYQKWVFTWREHGKKIIVKTKIKNKAHMTEKTDKKTGAKFWALEFKKEP